MACQAIDIFQVKTGISLVSFVKVTEKEKGNTNIACQVCSTQIFGEENVVPHIDGKKHRSLLSKFWVVENHQV